MRGPNYHVELERKLGYLLAWRTARVHKDYSPIEPTKWNANERTFNLFLEQWCWCSKIPIKVSGRLLNKKKIQEGTCARMFGSGEK
jgi:hypothetical protein